MSRDSTNQAHDSRSSRQALVSIGIGNTSIQCGRFSRESRPGGFPVPERTLRMDARQPDFRPLERFVPNSPVSWWVASVFREATGKLLGWLKRSRPTDCVRVLTVADIPFPIDVDRPDRVGMDRLVAALAVNHLRAPGRPAVVVDAGTAINIDAVSGEGHFLGGAILPGRNMTLVELNRQTDLLPLLSPDEQKTPPNPIGKNTEAAMRSGVHWGQIGAVKEVLSRITEQLGEELDVYFTGGGAESLASSVGNTKNHIPHLVLAGIVMAANQMSQS